MIQTRSDAQRGLYPVSIAMAGLGLLTIGGCISQLRRRVPAQE
jgi:hypothetical protein